MAAPLVSILIPCPNAASAGGWRNVGSSGAEIPPTPPFVATIVFLPMLSPEYRTLAKHAMWQMLKWTHGPKVVPLRVLRGPAHAVRNLGELRALPYVPHMLLTLPPEHPDCTATDAR